MNDESCSNHFVQYGALEGLTGDQSGPRADRRDPQGAPRRLRATCSTTIPGVRCFRPEATFYLFPNVTGLMERKGFATYDELRRAALEQTGVSFCTRLHFGRALPGEERVLRALRLLGHPRAPPSARASAELKEWAAVMSDDG